MSRYTETGEPSRLQQAREYLGVSHEQAAEALGWPVATLVQLEQGDTTITGEQLRKLSRLYSRPPGWFTGEFEFEPGADVLRMVENLTEGDREAVLDFAEFLQCAGPAPKISRADLEGDL